MDAHLTCSAEDPNNKALKPANYDSHFTVKLMIENNLCHWFI